jgi:PAS domain S-box-containing protein
MVRDHQRHEADVRVRSDGRPRGGRARRRPGSAIYEVTAMLSVGSVGIAVHDPTLELSSTESIRFLVRAGAVLASSLDYATTLNSVAHLAVPQLADWCVVHLADDGAAATQLTVAHVDPNKVSWALELQRRYPPDPNSPRGVNNILKTGHSELYPDISDEMLAASVTDEEHLALIRSVGMISALMVPLIARGRVLGVLTLVSAESGRHYGNQDLMVAEELARQCALAVDNSRLHRDAQAAEARARILFDGAADGILVFDENGRYRDVNPAMMTLLGQGRDELLGKRMGDLAADGQAPARERFARLRETGSLRFETTLRHRDGTLIPVESHATSVTLPDETLYLVIVRDTTERHRAAAEIQALNDELEQRVVARTTELAEVNRELEAFSYSVSHDLRAPLRVVDGFSRILVEDYGALLPDEAKRYLRIVRDGTEQMGRLIDDLLTFSRLGRQPLSLRTVQPAGLVTDILAGVRDELANRPVELVVDELPPCQADPALLRQVYANLLSNALKYTRGRAPAIIRVGALEPDEEAGTCVYFVKDNGVGFDMTYVGKLFGVFQRLHRAEDYEGTGVGLALVQRIVHRHGGRVWAEAAVDQGATFWFTLASSAADE